MEFETAAQKECYERVVPWMKDLYGQFVWMSEDQPLLVISMGSAVAQTAIRPWGDKDALVSTWSWVVTGCDTTGDLTRWLLEQNANVIFGCFCMDQEGDILFKHTLVGSTLDKEELQSCVNAVVMTADEYDDQIVSRWGGHRACDRRA